MMKSSNVNDSKTCIDRYYWIDSVKLIACCLVVLGHFFQSIVKASILPETNFFLWFDQTIYMFHVSLFFICSGYLYQNFSLVNSVSTYKNNLAKKALVLGVPYFFFSIFTVFLKYMFANSVNEKASGLFDTLFLHPASPYWYLYALFFIFMITITVKSNKVMFLYILFALVIKCASILGCSSPAFAVVYIMEREIWFVIGMSIAYWGGEKLIRKISIFHAASYFSIVLSVLFLVFSIIYFILGFNNGFIDFFLGLMACMSIIGICICRFNVKTKFLVFISQYTLPIYLMHTIFAASFRIVLLKIGVVNSIIHIIGGIIISFFGPIIAVIIMKKSKYLIFFLSPEKFITKNMI